MSWFRRKQKNRRLGGKNHVLDVKLRSDQVRASRFRWLALGFMLLFFTILFFYSAYRGGKWALNRLIYENKRFAIQTIEVKTDGVMSPDQLRRWSGAKTGENLLALDVARVKRDLGMETIVRAVVVERIPPGTLRLRVMEREPLARAAIYPASTRTNGPMEMKNFVEIDREAVVITPPEPRQRAVPPATNEVLPLITGIKPMDLIPGRAIPGQPVRSALELVQAFGRSQMPGLVDIQRIDTSSPGVLLVATAQGSEITFSIVPNDPKLCAQKLDWQMRRWHEVFTELQKKGKTIVTMDLSVPSNIPLRLVDASTTLAPAPRPKTTQPNRKKNV